MSTDEHRDLGAPDAPSPLAPDAAAATEAALAGTPSGSKRLVRALLFPLLRVLEPRFADTNRRLDDTRKSLHEEANLTRWVLEREVGGLRGSLEDYGQVSTESLTFVGTQLRELQDEIRELHSRIDELEARGGDGDAAPR